jgi:hypothetical protein
MLPSYHHFVQHYSKHCEERQLEPSALVISQEGSTLNLNGHALSQRHVEALSHALSTDCHYEILLLGDVFLGDEGFFILY